MKKLKKVLAVTTAAATMCISVSAFASEAVADKYQATFTGTASEVLTYNYATNTFTVNAGTVAELEAKLPGGVKAGTEVTILVLDQGTDEANVTQDDILYINQGTQNASADYSTTSMGLITPTVAADDTTTLVDSGKLPAGTTGTTENQYYQYKVKIGYTAAAADAENSITANQFVIANGVITMSAVPSEGNTRTFHILWGDVTGDLVITNADALSVLMGSIGTYDAQTITDTKGATYDINVGDAFGPYVWGKVTDVAGTITNADALSVLMGSIGTYDTQTINGQTVTINQQLSVTIDADKIIK